jgi:hypothetical protein
LQGIIERKQSRDRRESWCGAYAVQQTLFKTKILLLLASRLLKTKARAFVIHVARTADEKIVPVRLWHAFHRLALLDEQRVAKTEEEHSGDQLRLQLG